MGGAIRPCIPLEEMPLVPRHRKVDVVLVHIDNTRVRGSGRCRCLCNEIGAVFERKLVRSVIDLRRIRNRAVLFAHLKPRALDQAARDRTRSILLVCDFVVVIRAEYIRETVILDALIRACMPICILAHDVRQSGEAGNRDCTRKPVVEPRHRLGRIGRRAVVDLRHIAKCQPEITLLDRPRIAARNRLRGENCRPRRVEGIVVRLRTRATVKGGCIGDGLCLFGARCRVPVYILRGIVCRRGIRARLPADESFQFDERFACDVIPIAVCVVLFRIIGLFDVIVLNCRRQHLWRDLARARRVERIAQRFLGHVIRIKHIVVRELVEIIIIRLSRDRIGDLSRIADILRARRAVRLREMPRAGERKRNMVSITVDDARIATCRGI